MKKKDQRKKPGAKEKRLRVEGVDWKDAMKHALTKPKPEEWVQQNENTDDPHKEVAGTA